MAEFTKEAKKGDSEEHNALKRDVMAITMPSQLCWELYMDGAANPRGSGIGIVTISPARITIKKPLRLDFSTTNNKVEYEALITSLDSVKNLKGQSIIVSCDPRLVVRQV